MQMKTKYSGGLILGLFISISAYNQNYNDTIQEPLKLKEHIIVGNAGKEKFKTQTLDVEEKNINYLNANRSNSLMSTLEKIPGIKSMQIGQGQSKPVIRGLGFNRVAVIQNGIKQQGQQWGADHGLEIDQYDVEKVEIYKGAMSLQLGSDAIAGAIKIPHYTLEETDGLKTGVLLNEATNNRLFGTSVNSSYQKERKFLKARATYQNFEDYRVPAKEFDYLGWIFPIHNGILKNTAGRELNLALQAGIIGNETASRILVSNVYTKTGFFAGAHGIPSSGNLEDDGKYRNIGLPYQQVNHLKVVYNQEYTWADRYTFNADLGYQNNNRKEYSKPHTHGYGDLPNTNLELELKLQTFTFNPQLSYQYTPKSKFMMGISTEYQDNHIGGYSFLLPQFQQFTGGAYLINKTIISDKLIATSGIRYDWGTLRIREYIDKYLPPEYEIRAENLRKQMGDFSFSAGLSYLMNQEWNMKVNIGKSFRMPTANELSSNGVHHGTFRHELGDKNLKAESSYQVDYTLEFRKKMSGAINKVSFSGSTFANYFPNFIFLNPTGRFSWLPDAGQYYKYEQSKAFRWGGELTARAEFINHISFEIGLDYVYAQDINEHKPIPFTPPLNIINELNIHTDKLGILNEAQFIFTHRYTDTQNRTATNELKTPGYHLFDAGLSFCIPIQSVDTHFILQAQNLFDKKYYNHLSFYRNLDIPEIGRNFRLSVQFTF